MPPTIKDTSMTHVLRRFRFAAALIAIAAIPTGAALAGEGNGPSFPGNDVPNFGVSTAVGQTAPVQSGGLVIGGTLPPIGNSQGEPEPVNSLPPGFEDGTPAMQHRLALHSYWEGGQAPRPMHASRG